MDTYILCINTLGYCKTHLKLGLGSDPERTFDAFI